jgi:hypothetical protein
VDVFALGGLVLLMQKTKKKKNVSAHHDGCGMICWGSEERSPPRPWPRAGPLRCRSCHPGPRPPSSPSSRLRRTWRRRTKRSRREPTRTRRPSQHSTQE